jgi:hypothetical protein
MLKKYKWPLILAAGAAVVYFLFIKKGTSLVLGAAPSGQPGGTVDNAVVKRFPPPGYSGNSNIGPFTWAGMGEPTHGLTFIGWTAAEAQAKGYNWS